VAVALAGLIMVGGGGCSAAGSSFGDGKGFGLAATQVTPTLMSQTWGVRLGVAADAAQVTESEEGWTATNADSARASPQTGIFTFMVLRNTKVDGASPASVAELLRSGEVKRGTRASDIADAEFLGRPAAMFVSSPGENVFNVTVLTVSHKCVYVLSVTHAGDQSQAAEYIDELIDTITTFDGGPANAPACR
jgi:hypothetical protein